jgi:nucleoside-diphosphate-sugar epimerase
MTILNSNIVFGRDSYLVHYMTQCAAAGKINAKIGGSTGYNYKPVSTEDLSQAVDSALNNFNQVIGKRFIVNGKDETTLKDLMGILEQSVGKAPG